MNQLQQAIELLTKIANGEDTGIPAAELAGTLIRLAAAASKAHQEIAGQPIDLSKLHDIDLIP